MSKARFYYKIQNPEEVVREIMERASDKNYKTSPEYFESQEYMRFNHYLNQERAYQERVENILGRFFGGIWMRFFANRKPYKNPNENSNNKAKDNE